MKKILFLLAPAMLVAGCALEIEFADPEQVATTHQDGVYEIKTRSLDGAVYNEVVDAWMIPQDNPYALANFQAAYDKLAAGKSTQSLSKSITTEFPPAKRLKPTHYALKIYPHDEDEQWKVEMMEDVQVSYIPFGWAYVTSDEAGKVEKAKTRSAANTFAEKSPYTVTCENYKSTLGGPVAPMTLQLPILYTVWPVDKPLPDDLEYVVDHEVFLPRNDAKTRSGASALGEEAMSVLWGEALSLARGGSAQAPAPLQVHEELAEGHAYTYDNTLGRNVLLTHVNVTCTESMNNFPGNYVGSSGFFGVWVPVEGPDAIIGETYQHWITFTYKDPQQGRWKITSPNSTIPISTTLMCTFTGTERIESGQFREVDLTGGVIVANSSNWQENEIHRAVQYFFNTQNVFPKNTVSGGLRIIGNPGLHTVTGRKGSFTPPSTINIYNYGGHDASVIGTTLHELGHFTHYSSNTNSFNSSQLFLKEATALYFGWHLAHEYYRSHGLTIYPDQDITIYGLDGGQGSQMWNKTLTSMNIPLFVDLADNMNQVSYYGGFNPQNYPVDNITNVTPSVIWNTIINYPSWAQCRSRLQSYAGTGSGKYYTVSQFETWIDYFDDWLTTYSLYLNMY